MAQSAFPDSFKAKYVTLNELLTRLASTGEISAVETAKVEAELAAWASSSASWKAPPSRQARTPTP